MDKLKTHLHILTIIAIFTLAWSINSSRGLAAPGSVPSFAALGSTFTYDGRVSLPDGSYDLQFQLFSAVSAGSLVGAPNPQIREQVSLQAGMFRVWLDFGPAAFNGQQRFLEVGYRPATSSAAYTILGRDPLHPVPYAMSLRPGSAITGNLAAPAGSILRATNTGTGVGFWGSARANPGVYGESTGSFGVIGQAATGSVAGVLGRNTGPGIGVWGKASANAGVYGESTQSIGVVGQSGGDVAGVLGRNVGAGVGIEGQSPNAAGVYGSSTLGRGVWGTTTQGDSGVFGATELAGGSGVRGIANTGETAAGVYGSSAKGRGVRGVSSGIDGVGVAAANSAGGYAIQASGNATQDRSGGGWVKAMAYLDPLQSDTIRQCYNSQKLGVYATSGDCGLEARLGYGIATIDFGFPVADRFVSVTVVDDHRRVGVRVLPAPGGDINSIRIWTYFVYDQELTTSVPAPFYIIVY